MKRFKFKMPFY